jgi:hypothetical protein
MMTTAQSGRLVPYTVVALIVVAVLLHFFGPAELETDELIVIGVLILALIGFRIWLRQSE